MRHVEEPNRQRADRALTPLLVLGAGRSGTTLLMQLLGSSPQILFDRVYPFEVRYFTYLLRWALVLHQEWQPGNSWGPAEIFTPPDGRIGPFPYVGAPLWEHQQLWTRCFTAAWGEFSRSAGIRAHRDGPTLTPPLYYAEKIPFWVPAYVRQVIPYKIILLVRDPRDIFLSITAFDRKRGFPGFTRRPEDDDWTFAVRFVALCRERFKVQREETGSPGSILVKYERLAIDPEGEAQRLSQWLGVTLDVGGVDNHVPYLARHMTSESPRESVERWRRELSAKLNRFFVQELREELQHFGYET
ncbi:MAG: sulfotransferase [Kofleriaceae bacterium]|nr:sulfotransferase [Candidatus Methylomirabilis lanthanidiphila]